MAFRTATGRRGDVVLLSKFGMIGEFFLGRMVGGVFEGSQTPDFRRRDTLHLIREAPSRLVTQVRTDTAHRYRYVRYFGPYKGYCNISEVAFYGSPSDSLPLQGTVIGPGRRCTVRLPALPRHPSGRVPASEEPYARGGRAHLRVQGRAAEVLVILSSFAKW